MKVECWMIGKTAFPYLNDGMSIYEQRLKRYLPFRVEILPDIKNAKNLSSEVLKLQSSKKRLIFQIGGAYGFSEEIYKRADLKISLSKMTFSHQMIRLFFLEQLYRAMTILKGEPYHNE